MIRLPARCLKQDCAVTSRSRFTSMTSYNGFAMRWRKRESSCGHVRKTLGNVAIRGLDCFMSESERSEKLVQVHHARDEWEGNIIAGYLRESGVEATLQSPPAMPPLDAMENLSGSDKVN